MLAGHRLAVALGVVDGASLKEDDELSRKQLVRAGEAMVDAGLSIVLNRAGTKIPMCTLTAIERKRADQEAQDIAAAAGDPNSHKRRHRCGLVHAINERKSATRILTRLAKRGTFNIGVEPRASRVLIVDLDTAKQAAEFALRCGQDRPTLTVRSPGSRDKGGNWVHRDGGHIWFDVSDVAELPTSEGIYTDAAGWTAVWGEHQVLVPPSVRDEGAYVLVGSIHPLPQWLRDVVTTEALAKQERREESRRRRERFGPSAIDEWATRTSWTDILEADGWIDTGLVKNCGCPQWTAPGEHASPESATAHEPGCAVYTCERGHGPLRVWTDSPSDAVADAMDKFGTRTLTKIQVLTFTEGEGRMGRTLDDLGIEHPDNDRGPLILGTHSLWDEVADRRTTDGQTRTNSDSAGQDGSDDGDGAPDDDEEDDLDDSPELKIMDSEQAFERRVRKEFEHELVRRAALERIAAQDAAPLRLLDFAEFLKSPRPEPLVHKMLYRDSLARMFGAPGGGKSFLALDLAMAVALCRFWGGLKVKGGPVIYVMAEGQRVNGDRAAAWLSKHSIEPSELEGRFFTVPDAVLLTEAAAADFIKEVARIRPALVVLDTKNAMMAGEENSATDFAVMRRTLDAIRKAADCCVLLIDHTGYEGQRARGSSAGTAAMDTEIKVDKDDEQNPSLITVEITRDKAGEAGEKWAFHLLPEHPAAVLVPTSITDVKSTSADVNPDMPQWRDFNVEEILPRWIVDKVDGSGKTYLIQVARYMAFETSMTLDPSRDGKNVAQVTAALKPTTTDRRALDAWRNGVSRAWSQLKDKGCLQYFNNGDPDKPPTAHQERSGPHLWSGPTTPRGEQE